MLGYEITEKFNFSRFIIQEFENRKLRNPNYSLRAFARDLGVGASTLSSILRSEVNPSLKFVRDLLEKLNTSQNTIDRIILWERCSKCFRILDELKNQEKVTIYGGGKKNSFQRTVEIDSDLKVFIEVLFRLNDKVCRYMEEISDQELKGISFTMTFEEM
jgi:transcriptional regulator with XRE-family HTH domain